MKKEYAACYPYFRVCCAKGNNDFHPKFSVLSRTVPVWITHIVEIMESAFI